VSKPTILTRCTCHLLFDSTLEKRDGWHARVGSWPSGSS